MSDLPFRPLPTEIEGISRDWLSAALGTHAPDVAVDDFEIVDMQRSTCTKVRLRLAVNEAGRRAGIPETVILKGGFEPHSREMAYMHMKEARAYRDLLPELGLPHPACYFADYDEATRQGIVILEDLVARGVDFCSPLVPQSFDQVARRLGVLARFHARSWQSPDFEPGRRWDWVEDLVANQRHYFDPYLEPDVWQRFVASPRGAAASVRFHDRDWMSRALDRIAKLSAGLPHCIIHVDTHLGNLYVDPDGSPGFFDCLASRAPALLEVTYHLGCALDTADRPRWEAALIQHYLAELGRQGVAAPGFEEAMRQYACFLAYGYCIFIINESFFQMEAVNTAYTARFSAAMLQHRTAEVLESVGD